jgi:hypothetical protein
MSTARSTRAKLVLRFDDAHGDGSEAWCGQNFVVGALASLLLATATGCGPSVKRTDPVDTVVPSTPMEANNSFAPLEVGSDWGTYTRVNRTPFRSQTHGNRMVDVHVNSIGAASYAEPTAKIPVGTVVVKTSVDDQGRPGPLFVMEKRAAGYNPEHDDWHFAIHWAEPTGPWKKRFGGPIYWRTPSTKADYCADCHDGLERGLGGVPAESR